MKWKARVVGQITIPKDSRIVLDHAHVRGEDYSSRKLMQFCAIGSRFEGCRFENSHIDGASFGAGREMSEYVECSFDGARLEMEPGDYARFVRCSFRNVAVSHWKCFGLELVDCVFSGRLRTAIFNGTVPDEDRALLHRDRNEFHGNDFSAMELIDVAFRTGIDLTRQRLPSGPEYLYLADAVTTLEKTLEEAQAWQNDELRESAVTFLRGFRNDAIQGGQQQLLLRASDYYGYEVLPRDMIDQVFGLLRQYAQSGTWRS